MQHPTVAIIGGGISGLSAAYRLVQFNQNQPDDRQLKIVLFESAPQLGGVLQTQRRDDLLIESSADMFTTKDPWAFELSQEIGFADQLLEPNEQHRRAHVVRRGKLHPVPDGLSLLRPARLLPLLTSGLLSPLGKLRTVMEYFVGKRVEPTDESLASFSRRRFGKEMYEQVIQPLVGGIYTADPERLSMAATMPQFQRMEQEHGSLIRAARKSRSQTERMASGARYNIFRAPRDGMQSFVQAIAAKLDNVEFKLGCPIEKIERLPGDQGNPSSYQITTADQSLSFDAVIVATPATVAGKLLQPVSSPLAESLGKIPLAGANIAVLGLQRKQIQRPIDSFGFVVPLAEQRKILAGSFASIKFAGRAPTDKVIMRVFVGGACQPELLDLDDDQTLDLVLRELNELLGISGKPFHQQVVRWRNVMPQYHLGHVELVDQIDSFVAELEGLELAGNAFRGVGIPFCVRSGRAAADRVLASIGNLSTTNPTNA